MHGYYREKVKSWLHSVLDTAEEQQEAPVKEEVQSSVPEKPAEEEKRSGTGIQCNRVDVEKERKKNTELQRPVQEYMAYKISIIIVRRKEVVICQLQQLN